MVEAGANEVDDDTMFEAILFAQQELQPLIQLQKEVVAAVGKEKADIPYYRPLAEIEEKVFPVSYDKLKEVIVTDDKVLRNDLIDAARAEVKEMFIEEYPEVWVFNIGRVENASQLKKKALPVWNSTLDVLKTFE